MIRQFQVDLLLLLASEWAKVFILVFRLYKLTEYSHERGAKPFMISIQHGKLYRRF